MEFKISNAKNYFELWLERNAFELSVVKLPAKKYSISFNRSTLTIEIGSYTIIGFLR